MIITTLYKITNIVNNMSYYGIIWKKGKTIQERFEEHMNGKGGKLLYEKGVLIYGRNNFKIEMLKVGDFPEISKIETKYNKSNLWPIGYNGNTAHALHLTPEQSIRAAISRKKNWENNPDRKPIPPNWKGKTRSDKMRSKLSASKKGHDVSASTRQKLKSANLGKKQNIQTINKRLASLSKNLKSYNRKPWLFVSPDGKLYYSEAGAKILLQQTGCIKDKLFCKYLNTGLAVNAKTVTAKNNGWKFYNNQHLIDSILASQTYIINDE